MRQVRMYTQQVLAVDTMVELENTAKHHIDKVLRLKKGMSLTLFNGDGYDYDAEIMQLDRQQALVRVINRQFIENECDIDITLYCGLLKGDTMDRVIQKSVELGVKRLVPLQSKHTEVKLKSQRLESKMAHWQSIIYASSQQCGRAQLMQIEQPILLQEAIHREHQVCWIFSPHHKVVTTTAQFEKVNSVGLLIGPEGGFHDEEVDEAIASGWQTKTLGARVLRADTAAISSVLFAQFHFSCEYSNG